MSDPALRHAPTEERLSDGVFGSVCHDRVIGELVVVEEVGDGG